MTCYRLFLLCPVHVMERRNALNLKCLTLLAKQNGGYIREMRESNGSNVIVMDICDSDASDFLWHLPSPFTALFVIYRESQQLLFAHRVFGLKIPCRSRILDDKAVYWSAKSLENHLADVKIELEDYLYAVQQQTNQ
jgi:hypothetical protein